MKSMKSLLENLKVPLLSIALTAALEFIIVKLSGDNQSCFFHNTITGNIVSLIFRFVAFTILCALVSTLFLPKYSSLKDRLLEQEESREKKEQGSPAVYERANLNEVPA